MKNSHVLTEWLFLKLEGKCPSHIVCLCVFELRGMKSKVRKDVGVSGVRREQSLDFSVLLCKGVTVR